MIAAKEKTKREPQAPPLYTGDDVWVVYWSPFEIPGDPGAGTWETMWGRILSVGPALICFETANPGLAHGGTVAPVSLPSPNRWTTPDRVFRTSADAEAAARSLHRPSQP